MKYFTLILVFCVSQLSAQVASPSLRCLEVLGNGNVKLTWIAPQDPGNLFSSYEVYYSPVKNGPYTLVSLNINAITTTSFVHTSTTSLSQGCYYYTLTKYGSGGTNSSGHSDTLRTLFLNIPNPTAAIDLTFNHLHEPKLTTSGTQYRLLKEFPAGTWNILGSTTGTVYPDTISICKAKISYQVTLIDSAGCSSVSNLLTGQYQDSKAPDDPYVDSISVMPNGNTVLAWQIPPDKDIIRYEIQYRTPPPNPTNVVIDHVPGRLSTLYTYSTTTANSTTVGLFVGARDSCNRFSAVYYDLATMYLTTAYNRCGYETKLVWNNYHWPNVPKKPKQELLEYRIYYSVNGSAFTRVGATVDSFFTHTNVAPGKNICYFVRAVNKTGNITTSSNRACFFSDQVTAPVFLYMNTASVLDENRAFLKFYLDTSESSVAIDIERSENDSVYTHIGSIPCNGQELYTFTDEQADCAKKSYYYRAVVLDSCGNPRLQSNTCRTVLLKVSSDKDKMFTRYLSWNDYSGFGGTVSGYNVYRIVNEGHNEELIGSTDPLTTKFTDNLEEAAPEGAKVDYRVQAVEGLGNPYGFLEISNSNPVPVYVEGRIFVPNAFAPGGTNKTWLPVTHFVEKSEYHVNVFNRWGQKVFEAGDDEKAWDGAHCLPDVYVYLIDYKNARGEYMQVKGTVTLLR